MNVPSQASSDGFEQGPDGMRLRDYDSPEEAQGEQSAAPLAAELRSVAAILDVRGVAGEDEDVPTASSANFGRVLLPAPVILALAVLIIWWVSRA